VPDALTRLFITAYIVAIITVGIIEVIPAALAG
jgi:hypothetical protein